MVPNKMLPVAVVILFFMLGVVWWPSYSNLGDLFGYAQSTQYKGVTLLHLFKAELVVLVIVWAFLISYKKGNNITDGNKCVKQYLILIMFVVAQAFTGSFAGGFLVHQDAPWYQVIHNANEVMPSQAIILLICYPLYLFFGGSAFIYATTRMPKFVKNKEVAFMVLTFAPLAFLPYYDSSLVEVKADVAELAYMAAYWLLSVSWIGLGVAYIIVCSVKEILHEMSDRFGEM